MKEFYRVLSPLGTLAFSELLPDPDYPRAKALIRMATPAGFWLKKKTGNFFHYTLIFEKEQLANKTSREVCSEPRRSGVAWERHSTLFRA